MVKDGKDKTRDIIIQCAMDIIINEGFDKLSMRRIAKKLPEYGLEWKTAANLYNYYKNKNILCLDVDAKSYEMLFQMVTKAVNSQKSELDKVRALIEAFIEFGTKYVSQYDMMFSRIDNPKTKEFMGTEDERFAKRQLRRSLKNFAFGRDVLFKYVESNPKINLSQDETNFLFIRLIAQVHGFVSLQNSGILDEFQIDAKEVINETVEYIIDSFKKGKI
jgi:AcrR family transcriptional regulator